MSQPPGSEAILEGLRRMCARAGLRFDELDPSIAERMQVLAELTPTLEDCDRALIMAAEVFRFCDQHGNAFSEVEKSTVRLGTLFSDIGKAGPARANAEQQRLVAEMFAVERVPNERMSVDAFLAHYFPADASRRREVFTALGLDLAMTMRQFWNLHSLWTLEVTLQGSVPHEAVAAAATHHLLEDINPAAIVGEDGSFTRAFGSNATFDRPEKLVIMLDKYDAARRRAQRSHSEAIAWLRVLIDNHPRFRRDADFNQVIDLLDATSGSWVAKLYPSEGLGERKRPAAGSEPA